MILYKGLSIREQRPLRAIWETGYDSDCQICQVFIFHWEHLNLTALILNASVYIMLEISPFANAYIYDFKMYIFKRILLGTSIKV